MEGDLKLLVPQGPGHLRSETIGPSLVPSLGPVSPVLPVLDTAQDISVYMLPSFCAVDKNWEKHRCVDCVNMSSYM